MFRAEQPMRHFINAMSTQGTASSSLFQNYWQQIQFFMGRCPPDMQQFGKDRRDYYSRCPPSPYAGTGADIKNNGHDANIKLNNHEFTISKDNGGTIIIDGKATVWGDPHYKDASGKTTDIMGDTKTVLADGTKLYIDTTDASGNHRTHGWDRRATTAGRIGIESPDGTTVFVDNIQGNTPLQVTTPPPGRFGSDFIREKMRGDFEPEAVLSIDQNNGQWTTLEGKPLTPQDVTQMQNAARAGTLTDSLFNSGCYPRRLTDHYPPHERSQVEPDYRNAMRQQITIALNNNFGLSMPMCDKRGKSFVMNLANSREHAIFQNMGEDIAQLPPYFDLGQSPFALIPWARSA